MSDLSILHGCVTIQLTKGKATLIDQESLPFFAGRSWTTACCAGLYYAIGSEPRPEGVGRRNYYVHRRLWSRWNGEIPPRARIDHKNRDSLDNRRENIRLAVNGQNNFNSRKKGWRGPTSSKFKGVSLYKRTGAWRAVITKGGQQIELGHYHDERDAARAYNRAACRLFGEFAKINEDV